jgi:hypothetical protein
VNAARDALARLVLIGSIAVAGCGITSTPEPDQMVEHVAALTAVLPVLEELEVYAFRDQDWCKNIALDDRFFSTNNETSTCNLHEDEGEPFDADAERDFARLKDSLRDTGLPVRMVDGVDIDVDGRVTRATFELEVGGPPAAGYMRYVYAPGEPLPEQLRGELESTRVDEDWYFQWEDWM